MKQINLLLLISLLFLSSCSKEDTGKPSDTPPDNTEGEGTKITIENVKAGELAQSLTTLQWQDVKYLTISGNLNDSDFATLRNKASQLVYLNIGGITLTSIPTGAFSKRKTVNEPSLPSEQETGWTIAYPDLEEIIIPDETLLIDEAAFAFCTKLSKLSLPDALRTIRKFAFIRNNSLVSLTLPPNLDTIGEKAFFGSVFPQVKFPASLKYIGTYAFAESQLTSVAISENISTIQKGAFANNLQLTDVKIEAPLYLLPMNLFAGCRSLKTVRLNENITKIGISAFSGCESLQSIILPAKIKVLEGGAFSQCTNLIQIVLPVELDSLGGNVFEECRKLETVDFPENLKSIHDYAFHNCNSLKKAILPENLEELGTHTFENCTALEEVYIPHTLKINTIEQGYAPAPFFNGCNSLNKITFSPDLVKIPDGLFYELTALTQLSLPAHIKMIGAFSYANCENLTSVHLSNIEEIGKYAFSNLPILENATIGSDPTVPLKVGQYAFTGCPKLKYVEFTGRIDSISIGTFWQCDALEAFEVPGGVTTICRSAFSFCPKLEKLSFPATLEKIEDGIINGSPGIKELICRAVIPPLMEDDPTFYISGYSSVKVPAQSVERYKQAPGWKNVSYAISALDE